MDRLLNHLARGYIVHTKPVAPLPEAGDEPSSASTAEIDTSRASVEELSVAPASADLTHAS
eukprot:254723-Pleurochrysis_carterae.AAC.1